jgi:sodium/bile acid cotransporter 7
MMEVDCNVVVKAETPPPTTTSTSNGVADENKGDADENKEEMMTKELESSSSEEEDIIDTTVTTATPTTISNNLFRKVLNRIIKFYWENEFLILIVIVICLAKVYPPLGAIYLAPHITATWIAVMLIFLLAGLSLKTEEFSKAFTRIYFNTFVLSYNFGVDSSFVFGVSRLLSYYNIISTDLADGMVIASCVPLTINMCVVLTKSSGGDEASAICNAAFGNLIGVFLSPALIIGYIGMKGSVDVITVFYKLAIRVLVPIIIGQLLKKFCPPINDFIKKYKKYFKQGQQYCLIFIVYTVFCTTFNDENSNISVKEIILMIIFIALILIFLMIFAWFCLYVLFKNEPTLRVMGLYGCTHKTVAMGIPLINAIYDGNPAIGLYTLPLLIWHPMQLIIGTFLSPRLALWVETKQNEIEIEIEKKKKEQEQEQEQEQEEQVVLEVAVAVAEITTNNENENEKNNDNDKDGDYKSKEYEDHEV